MKLLITEACQIAGESVSQHADVGTEVDLPKDEAILLARMRRAMFLDKADDPSKGAMTASAEDKATVKKRATAIADARKAA